MWAECDTVVRCKVPDQLRPAGKLTPTTLTGCDIGAMAVAPRQSVKDTVTDDADVR